MLTQYGSKSHFYVVRPVHALNKIKRANTSKRSQAFRLIQIELSLQFVYGNQILLDSINIPIHIYMNEQSAR